MLLMSHLPSKHRRRLNEGCDGQDPSMEGRGATRVTEALREPQTIACGRWCMHHIVVGFRIEAA
jgi:hypothetical protein